MVSLPSPLLCSGELTVFWYLDKAPKQAKTITIGERPKTKRKRGLVRKGDEHEINTHTSRKWFPTAIYWMNIWVNRHHSCKCVGQVILAPQIQPICCIRCSPIKWGKVSWLAFTKKIQEGSHVRRWVIWLLQEDLALNNLKGVTPRSQNWPGSISHKWLLLRSSEVESH